jgi:hypothetical protein
MTTGIWFDESAYKIIHIGLAPDYRVAGIIRNTYKYYFQGYKVKYYK